MPGTTRLPALFQPIQVGDITLGHRVVFAPLTRLRANKHGVHADIGTEYYTQRASVPGTLLISEATYVGSSAQGRSPNAPGIYTEDQINSWKRITDAVHAKGSFIYMQIWALGRAARITELRKEQPDFPYVSASDVPLTGRTDIPRPLTIAEIKSHVEAFAEAARNAVHKAGFDGVEVHCAHGYLIDQFLQEMSNRRTDEYGGSVENRCRFALEIVDAVSRAIGEEKTAVRISPWSEFQDMRMPDPLPTFTYLVSRLASDHPNLAFLHVVEPEVSGAVDRTVKEGESNEFIRKIWQPRALVSAGGYTRERALQVAEETGQLIAFGRPFISNPDLPRRLLKNIPLASWEDREFYYTPEEPRGYIDYPAADDEERSS
ncbi:NADH:flavin oxidoreductase/NADH oxidase [Trametes versicolor FP-101664 SS1]|uniref:NADH:flavin oxidoreductase/NADH oxidase n=1 Tax=Trametes versicolor (strain FP-101664) TaxID=717944 RepID=UPI00046218B0|nr:NADH:flavin oxidoreductase/NADH oxidase [Trametes versicolor FP-101664 SS1]EIW56409.1 NADH:flavin oxidoreductase/NADH oxidase [Trametes versicolor FP-101664 SS1]